MKIIMHYPDEGKKELACQVSHIHGKTVLSFLCSLSCSLEQKLLLLDQIKEAVSKAEH